MFLPDAGPMQGEGTRTSNSNKRGRIRTLFTADKRLPCFSTGIFSSQCPGGKRLGASPARRDLCIYVQLAYLCFGIELKEEETNPESAHEGWDELPPEGVKICDELAGC